MKRELPDRSQILFGRQPDLDYLLQRTERPGLTAVVGRAQMGKSWLLTEFARQLSVMKPPASTVPSILAQPPVLVGFTEALGETADLLLRAVVDLYSRWLSDSTYSQQAKIVYAQQNHDLIGRTGKAVGNLFEKISKLAFMPGEVVGGLVKDTFESLASANEDLSSGQIRLPRLQIEQARDLLLLVHKIINCRIVLVFDQWEKSTGIQLESNILDSFLRSIEDWPPCHIVLGLRPDDGPLMAIRKLERGFPGVVDTYELPPMHLEDGHTKPLLEYVRNKVSANAVSDKDLLNMIAGYPGTISRWTSAYYGRQLNSQQKLQDLADDANAYRFAEFDSMLPGLSDAERRLSILFAILPAVGNSEGWNALRNFVMHGAQPKDLDTLKRKGILESSPPPTYGHSKRAEAALQWFFDNFREELRELYEELVLGLAAHVQDLTLANVPYASSLADLDRLAPRLQVSACAHALCEAGLSLFKSREADSQSLLAGVAELSGNLPQLAPLMAMGVGNALYYAIQKREPPQRDTLLNALRKLTQVYPEGAVVQEQLAMGLYNTLHQAKDEEKNPQEDEELLEELRVLRQTCPNNAPVRKQLAMGLFNMLHRAEMRGALASSDLFLEELRTLAHTYPDDAFVRESLARGLFNSAIYPEQRHRESLLEELRELTRTCAKDASVRAILAMALVNSQGFAKQQGSLARRDALLDELREIARTYPTDSNVREQLAKGLFNTLNDARQEGARARRDELLDQLRELKRCYSEDAPVRERLAKALFNTLIDAKEQGVLERRDALLEEVLQLARSYPDDSVVREVTAPLIARP